MDRGDPDRGHGASGPGFSPLPAVFLVVGILAVVVLVVLLLVVAGSTEGQTPPPASGDWIISDTTVVEDINVVIENGNIIITGGGSLTLRNVSLFMNETAGADRWIDVEDGAMVLEGCVVGPINTTEVNNTYPWRVQDTGTLVVHDSEISGLGSVGSPHWINGLRVQGSVSLDNVTVRDGHGVVVFGESSSATIVDLWAYNVTGAGLGLSSCYGISVEGLRVNASDSGLYLACWDSEIRDVRINETQGVGITIQNSFNAVLDNVTVEDAGSHGIYASHGYMDVGWMSISNTTVRTCGARASSTMTAGIFISSVVPCTLEYWINDTEISGCPIGIIVKAGRVNIHNSSVLSSTATGIYLDSSVQLSVQNTTISKNVLGLHVSGLMGPATFECCVWSSNGIHVYDGSHYGSYSVTWTGDTFKATADRSKTKAAVDLWLEEGTWILEDCVLVSDRAALFYNYNGTMVVSNSSITVPSTGYVHDSDGSGSLVLDNSTFNSRSWTGDVTVRWAVRCRVLVAGAASSNTTVSLDVVSGPLGDQHGTTGTDGRVIFGGVPDLETVTISTTVDGSTGSQNILITGYADVNLCVSSSTWTLSAGWSSVTLTVTPSTEVRASDLVSGYPGIRAVFWLSVDGLWEGLTVHGGTDAVMVPGTGYMVQTTETEVVGWSGAPWTGSVLVRSGWSLVPLPGREGMEADQVLQTIGNGTGSLARWSGGSWDVVSQVSWTVSWTVRDGTAYMIYAAEAVDIDPREGF